MADGSTRAVSSFAGPGVLTNMGRAPGAGVHDGGATPQVSQIFTKDVGGVLRPLKIYIPEPKTVRPASRAPRPFQRGTVLQTLFKHGAEGEGSLPRADVCIYDPEAPLDDIRWLCRDAQAPMRPIDVVHPDWAHACIKAGRLLPTKDERWECHARAGLGPPAANGPRTMQGAPYKPTNGARRVPFTPLDRDIIVKYMVDTSCTAPKGIKAAEDLFKLNPRHSVTSYQTWIANNWTAGACLEHRVDAERRQPSAQLRTLQHAPVPAPAAQATKTLELSEGDDDSEDEGMSAAAKPEPEPKDTAAGTGRSRASADIALQAVRIINATPDPGATRAARASDASSGADRSSLEREGSGSRQNGRPSTNTDDKKPIRKSITSLYTRASIGLRSAQLASQNLGSGENNTSAVARTASAEPPAAPTPVSAPVVPADQAAVPEKSRDSDFSDQSDSEQELMALSPRKQTMPARQIRGESRSSPADGPGSSDSENSLPLALSASQAPTQSLSPAKRRRANPIPISSQNARVFPFPQSQPNPVGRRHESEEPTSSATTGFDSSGHALPPASQPAPSSNTLRQRNAMVQSAEPEASRLQLNAEQVMLTQSTDSMMASPEPPVRARAAQDVLDRMEEKEVDQQVESLSQQQREAERNGSASGADKAEADRPTDSLRGEFAAQDEADRRMLEALQNRNGTSRQADSAADSAGAQPGGSDAADRPSESQAIVRAGAAMDAITGRQSLGAAGRSGLGVNQPPKWVPRSDSMASISSTYASAAEEPTQSQSPGPSSARTVSLVPAAAAQLQVPSASFATSSSSQPTPSSTPRLGPPGPLHRGADWQQAQAMGTQAERAFEEQLFDGVSQVAVPTDDDSEEEEAAPGLTRVDEDGTEAEAKAAGDGADGGDITMEAARQQATPVVPNGSLANSAGLSAGDQSDHEDDDDDDDADAKRQKELEENVFEGVSQVSVPPDTAEAAEKDIFVGVSQVPIPPDTAEPGDDENMDEDENEEEVQHLASQVDASSEAAMIDDELDELSEDDDEQLIGAAAKKAEEAQRKRAVATASAAAVSQSQGWDSDSQSQSQHTWYALPGRSAGPEAARSSPPRAVDSPHRESRSVSRSTSPAEASTDPAAEDEDVEAAAEDAPQSARQTGKRRRLIDDDVPDADSQGKPKRPRVVQDDSEEEEIQPSPQRLRVTEPSNRPQQAAAAEEEAEQEEQEAEPKADKPLRKSDGQAPTVMGPPQLPIQRQQTASTGAIPARQRQRSVSLLAANEAGPSRLPDVASARSTASVARTSLEQARAPVQHQQHQQLGLYGALGGRQGSAAPGPGPGPSSATAFNGGPRRFSRFSRTTSMSSLSSHLSSAAGGGGAGAGNLSTGSASQRRLRKQQIEAQVKSDMLQLALDFGLAELKQLAPWMKDGQVNACRKRMEADYEELAHYAGLKLPELVRMVEEAEGDFQAVWDFLHEEAHNRKSAARRRA